MPSKDSSSPKGEMVKCLGGCDKKFLSKDKRTNRICPACSRKIRDTHIPRVAKFGTDNGKPINISGDE